MPVDVMDVTNLAQVAIEKKKCQRSWEVKDESEPPHDFGRELCNEK